MRLLLLLLALGRCAYALDYSITTTGPHHVVITHSLFFNITGTVIVGPDESVTPTITGVPPGAVATFPNLLKFCCTTFRIGIAGDNPVQIAVTTAIPGTYPLTITYTSLSNVVRTTSYSLIIDAIPGPLTLGTFPAATALAGLAQWQTNMTTFGATYCPGGVPNGPAFEGFVWYYDGTRNYYQIASYTGDPQWLVCARSLDASYLAYVNGTTPYTTSPPGNIPGWRVFPKGLAIGYTRDGVTANKAAIQSLQTQGYADFSNVAAVIDWTLSREMSYGLETNLESEALGSPRIANFYNVVDVLFGIFDQWFQSQTASYTQPFMVALACESLIQYWEATGDPRVPPMIKLAADQLMAVSYDAGSQSFFYYNNNGTPSSPNIPGCVTSGTVTVPCKEPTPDLNLLIVPLFGFVYQRTADITYRNEGDAIFNAGVAGAFLGAGKQFSQNYRWSGKYVTWRNSPGAVTISGAVIK